MNQKIVTVCYWHDKKEIGLIFKVEILLYYLTEQLLIFEINIFNWLSFCVANELKH